MCLFNLFKRVYCNYYNTSAILIYVLRTVQLITILCSQRFKCEHRVVERIYHHEGSGDVVAPFFALTSHYDKVDD